MRTDHPIYAGGPPCSEHCPGAWSEYHDGYADGYERGTAIREALLIAASDLGEELIRAREAVDYADRLLSRIKDVAWGVEQ